MSSAVAYLCHFKGSMEVFHWDILIHLYLRPYTLDAGGWESYRCCSCHTRPCHREQWRQERKPCDLQIELIPDVHYHYHLIPNQLYTLTSGTSDHLTICHLDLSEIYMCRDKLTSCASWLTSGNDFICSNTARRWSASIIDTICGQSNMFINTSHRCIFPYNRRIRSNCLILNIYRSNTL